MKIINQQGSWQIKPIVSIKLNCIYFVLLIMQGDNNIFKYFRVSYLEFSFTLRAYYVVIYNLILNFNMHKQDTRHLRVSSIISECFCNSFYT